MILLSLRKAVGGEVQEQNDNFLCPKTSFPSKEVFPARQPIKQSSYFVPSILYGVSLLWFTKGSTVRVLKLCAFFLLFICLLAHTLDKRKENAVELVGVLHHKHVSSLHNFCDPHSEGCAVNYETPYLTDFENFLLYL
jgi:hypothetical protein